jgi:hypothetical protein
VATPPVGPQDLAGWTPSGIEHAGPSSCGEIQTSLGRHRTAAIIAKMPRLAGSGSDGHALSRKAMSASARWSGKLDGKPELRSEVNGGSEQSWKSPRSDCEISVTGNP